MKIYGKDFELNTSAPSANVSFSLNKENMFAFGFEVPRADVRKPTIIPMGEYCCKYKVMLADGISTPPMQVSIHAISDKNVNLCVETGANVDAPMFEIIKAGMLCGCCRPAEPSIIDIIGKYGIRTIFNLDACGQCGNRYTGGYAAFGNFYEPAAGCVKVDAEAMYQPITMKMFRKDGESKGVDNAGLCEVYHLRCSGEWNGDMCIFGWQRNAINDFAMGANDIGFAWRWRDFVECANAWWEKNCGFSLCGIPCLQENTYIVLPNTRESYYCAPWIRYECGGNECDFYYCVCVDGVWKSGIQLSGRSGVCPEIACCKMVGFDISVSGLPILSFLGDVSNVVDYYFAYVNGDNSKYYGVTRAIDYSQDLWRCLDPRGCPILYLRYVCISTLYSSSVPINNWYDLVVFCGGGICGVPGYSCQEVINIVRDCMLWSQLGKVKLCFDRDEWLEDRLWDADDNRFIRCTMRCPCISAYSCTFAWSPTCGMMTATQMMRSSVCSVYQYIGFENRQSESCWGTTIDGRPETDTMLEGCSCFPSVANFFSCGIIDTIRRVVLTYNYNISGTNVQSERAGVFTLDNVINYCIYSDNDYNVNYNTEYDPNFICWREVKDGREPLLSQVKVLTRNYITASSSQRCYLFPITYVAGCCCGSGCLPAWGGVGYACAYVGERSWRSFPPYFRFISNIVEQPLFLLPAVGGEDRCCYPNFIWDVCERKEIALIAGDEYSEDIHALVENGYGQQYRSLDIRYCAKNFISMHNAIEGNKNWYSYDMINRGEGVCCSVYCGDLRCYIQNARRECQNAIQITAQSSDTLTILKNGVGSCFVWGGSRWKIVKIDNYNPSAMNNCLKVTGFMV